MKRYCITSTILLALVVLAGAAPVTRIFDRGIGWNTVVVRKLAKFNTAKSIVAPEIARKPYDYPLPACQEIFYVWDGTNVAAASPAVKAAILQHFENAEDDQRRAEADAILQTPAFQALWNQINVLRTNASLPALTQEQIRTLLLKETP